jgi:hypothetical protein
MSKEKFTPGPWKVGGAWCDDFNNEVVSLFSVNDEKIAIGDLYNVPENSALICAAPDLYEALKSAKQYIEELDRQDIASNWSGMDQLNAALTKAITI